MLSIIIVFWNDLDSWGNQEGWIESNTELSDEIDITGFEAFQEVGGSGLGNSTQIGNELVFSHTDTIIDNFENMLIRIELYLDF